MNFSQIAAGTYLFLEIIHKNVILLFLDISAVKHMHKLHNKIALFYKSTDKQLERALLIAD